MGASTTSQLLLQVLHPFNGLFQDSLDLNEARDDGVLGQQWHQLDHMQTICTSLQTDTTRTSHRSIFTGWMLFLTPNQQCQSTKGITYFRQHGE